MRFKPVLLIIILFLGFAGPGFAQGVDGVGSQAGTASQAGSTAASAVNAAAAYAGQSQQQQQSQTQSQLGVFNSYSNMPTVNVANGSPVVNAPGAQATTSTTEYTNSPTVNVSNNSPSLYQDVNSPALVINYPDQPTGFPGFAVNVPGELPFMRHHDINRAWNTCPSLFDMSLDWDHGQIGTYDKRVVVDGKGFGKAEGTYNSIRIFVSKDEAMKAATTTTLPDGKAQKRVRYLYAGSAHGDVEGVSILDCEMAALAKARELGGNGVVVKIEGFTVASKTKGKR